MNYRLTTSLLIFTTAVSLVAPAFVAAQTVTSTPQSRATAAQNDKVTKLKTKAEKEIDRRLAALNLVITQINNLKKLSSDNKTALTNGVQAQITSLTTLRAKIDADTDIATLRTDVKSIIDAYRIFAFYIPQIHILAAADVLSTITDNLTTLSTRLQTQIQAAQTQGANVTALQTALTDLQAKTTDAQKQYQAVESAVVPLTPDGYPANKTTLQNARAMLRVARQDIVTARKDAQTIVDGLKALSATPTPVPSTTSSASPSVAPSP